LYKHVLILISFLIICNTAVIATPSSLNEIIPIKTFAKGQAVSAERMGIESVYSNPAGLTAIDGITYSASYSSFYENLYSSMGLSIGTKLDENIYLGISAPVKLITDIPETVEVNGVGAQIGSFSDIETAGIITLAMKLNQNINIGMNTSYYYHKIYNETASGLSLDLGVIADYGQISVGASIQNIGNSDLTWSTGLTEKQKQRISIGTMVEISKAITLLGDAVYEKDNIMYNLGGELKFSSNLSIPFGINDISGINSLRLGVQLNLEKLSWNYAFCQQEDLGLIHKLSIEVGI
jgi:hypothetical protein